MVIHYLLTVLDAVTAFVLISHTALGWFSSGMVVSLASYLIIKGIIFALSDFASRIDIAIGIYIVLVALNIFSNNIMTIISVVWLAQKFLFIIFSLMTKIFF